MEYPQLCPLTCGGNSGNFLVYQATTKVNLNHQEFQVPKMEETSGLPYGNGRYLGVGGKSLRPYPYSLYRWNGFLHFRCLKSLVTDFGCLKLLRLAFSDTSDPWAQMCIQSASIVLGCSVFFLVHVPLLMLNITTPKDSKILFFFVTLFFLNVLFIIRGRFVAKK